jgi:hypothetical protein
MPALPFDPTDLAAALPDVLWAVGIAFILAVVTFKPPKPPSIEEAMAAMGFTSNDDDAS